MKENYIKMKEETTKKGKQLRFNDDFKACKIKERSFNYEDRGNKNQHI